MDEDAVYVKYERIWGIVPNCVTKVRKIERILLRTNFLIILL